jgi:hypothetical protein
MKSAKCGVCVYPKSLVSSSLASIVSLGLHSIPTEAPCALGKIFITREPYNPYENPTVPNDGSSIATPPNAPRPVPAKKSDLHRFRP